MKRLGLFLAALALGSLALPRCPAGEPLPPEKPAQLVVDVSGCLIHAAVSRCIDRTEPFHEVILDTQVNGMRRTVAKVRAELAPDPERGAVWIIVRGTTHARGIGRLDRLLTHSTSVTTFEVGQLIAIDANTIRKACGPSFAKSSVCLLCATGLNGDPDTLSAQLAPVGFQQQKQEVEAITASLAVKQATQQFEEELAPALVTGRQTLAHGLAWAKNARLEVESLRFSTGSHHLQARVRLAKAEVKEIGPRPALPPEVDMGIRVHESLVNQGARAMLGGKTFTLTELTRLSTRITNLFFKDGRMDAPKDSFKIMEKLLKAVSDKEPTLTLADRDPLTVRFGDDGFTLEAHVAKVTLGSLELGAIRTRASYRLETKDGSLLLVRQGPVEFLPASATEDEKKLMALALPFRVLVQAVAEEIFKSRLSLGELALPSQLTGLSALRAAHVSTSKEWLTVGWKLPPAK